MIVIPSGIGLAAVLGIPGGHLLCLVPVADLILLFTSVSGLSCLHLLRNSFKC